MCLLDLRNAFDYNSSFCSLSASNQRVLEFPSGLVVSGRGVDCQAPPITLATRSAVLDFALQMNSSDSVFYDRSESSCLSECTSQVASGIWGGGYLCERVGLCIF